MNIPIVPKEIIKEATSIAIDIPNITLNSKAFIRVIFYDSSNNVISTDSFELFKPDYNLWLQDDDLIDYICEKYNIERSD
jgi:hypothetical protein